MVHPSTLTFLGNLAGNNNKPWFEEHRDDYERAKQNVEEIAGVILESLAKTEPEFRELKAKNCVFRIYRDVRFSKDKSPYKSNMGAHFSKHGKSGPTSGYYMHIEPGKCYVGGGIWMPEASVLKVIRQEIDYNFAEFRDIVEGKAFTHMFGQLDGEKLKTPPKGYDADNAAIEYLKMKSFVAGKSFTDEQATSAHFVKDCTNVFATLRPMLDFINRALN
jgi:uncharacterized protein (TIGR02453 family)